MRFLSQLLIFMLVCQNAWAGLPPTTTQGGNDASKVTTFNLHLPGRALTHVGTDAWVPSPVKSKEYIQNGDFESNSTTGWTLCNTTLTSGIPTGTITNTAASFNALSVTSTSPVAGTYSLSVASSGATTAGQGFCSSTFTLDAEDSTISPRVQTIRASYSGTANMNFSGTSSNTWAVYVYDVTNSQWIQPAGVYDFVGDGKVVATFQPNITSSQYKLVFLNVNASSGAISMKWDSFSVGPQAAPIAPAMSDSVSDAYTFTYNGMGTTSSSHSVTSRTGDKFSANGQVVMGTVAASTCAIILPSGLSIDTTKAGANQYPFGDVIEVSTGATYSSTSNGPFILWYDGSTADRLFISNAGAAGTLTKQNCNAPFVSNALLEFKIKDLPIAGWSSNTVSSADTDNRTVAMMAYGPSSAATANNPIIFPNVFKDTHAAYNPATGQYTAPSSGWYQVQAGSDGTVTGGNAIYVSVAGNTAAGANRPYIGFAPNTNSPIIGTATVYATQGQTIDVRCTVAYGAGSVASDTFQITKVLGPAVVTATESVSMRYKLAGSSALTQNSEVVVKYDTKEWDTHNAYNTSTGLYTPPSPGTYMVDGTCAINSSGGRLVVDIYKNGALDFGGQDGSITGSNTQTVAGIVHVNQGDTIDIHVFTSLAGNSCVVGSHIAIARIGN